MDIQYSPEARQWADGLPLLEKASALLAHIAGTQSSQGVKAEWNRIQDREGRMLYRMTIRDSMGEASTDFSIDELQNPLHMQFRMARLWGDLLEIRNDRQHREVQIISSQIAAGVEGP